MPAELETHGGEKLVRKIGLAARAETLEQRRAKYGGWCTLVDRSRDCPATFAGIGHAAAKLREARVLRKCTRGEIEQPGCNDAAAPPDLGHVRQVEVKLVVLWLAER